MKADVKIACIIFLAMCLVLENEAWWSRRSSSSRRAWRSTSSRSSSSSSRSSSSSSSRSSSTTRRGWLRRPKVRKPPTVRPTAASNTKRYPTRCSIRFGCIPRYLKPKAATKSASKHQSSSSSGRGWWKKGQKTTKKVKPNTYIYVGHVGGYGGPKQKPENRKWVYGRGHVTIKSKDKETQNPGNVKAEVTTKEDSKDSKSSSHSSSNQSLVLKPEDCFKRHYVGIYIKSINISVLVRVPDFIIVGCSCKSVVRFLNAFFFLRFFSNTATIPSQDYFKNVTKVRLVERPLKFPIPERVIRCLQNYNVKTTLANEPGKAKHSGALLTTAEGDTFLIDKSAFYKDSRKKIRAGIDWSKGWEIKDTIVPTMNRTIQDYYNTIDGKYNLLSNNCHHATLKIKELALSDA